MSDPRLSVVVPVLNEAEVLPGLLDRLSGLVGPPEVVVADGGSSDGTVAAARAHPLAAAVVEARGGRGPQLNAGAEATSGGVLLFLHADTRLSQRAWAQLRAAARDPAIDGGNFDVRFDEHDVFGRALTEWRRVERRLGSYWGDSAIFCRRAVFDALGGYRPIPVMEDYDFARRLERGYRTVCLHGPVLTSTRRWRRLGIGRTFLSWNVIRWLYLLGVPAARLASLYRHAR